MHFAVFAISVVLIASFSTVAYSQKSSEYVSLKPDSCKAPDNYINNYYSSRDLLVSECLANVTVQSLPLRLFIVSTDERSWIDLEIGNTIWSSEEEIVYEKENQFGFFPNVGNTPAELRASSTGVTGLIFRVTAQNPDQQLSNSASSTMSRLFVLGFRDHGVCFLGQVRSNAIARNLLDSNAACKRMLKTEKLNQGK